MEVVKTTVKEFLNLTDEDFIVIDGRLYDYVIYGDGSGSVFNKSSGWSASLHKQGKHIVDLIGGASCGSNNFAELMPAFHGLYYLANQLPAQMAERPRVLIVSDSELTVNCGNRKYQRNSNLPLWALIEEFTETFDIVWEWRPRNSDSIMSNMDKNGKFLRKEIERIVAEI